MIKILFICHGNICRSPMAEYVMKDLVHKQGYEKQFHIESRATSREEIGNHIHPGTRKKMREVGIPTDDRCAIQLTSTDYKKYDFLIGMDNWNQRNILRIVGQDPEEKVHLLLEYAGQTRDIADPWYTGNFDATYEDVLLGCNGLMKFILEQGLIKNL